MQHADLDISIASVSADSAALTFGGRAELGYRAAVGGLLVEPSAAASISTGHIDGFTMSTVDVGFSDSTLLSGETRLRVSRTVTAGGLDLTPFALFTVGYAGGDASEVTLSGFGETANAGSEGLYGGLAGGLSLATLDGATVGYLRAELKGNDDAYLMDFKVGGSHRF